MAGRAALRIELLGGFRVLADGRPLAQPVGARQQELIAFLVLHGRQGPVQRQRVSGSLWPESTDVQALTNLRRELHHLQRSPKLYSLIDVGTRTLAWRDAASSAADVVGFEAAAARGIEGDRAALREAARLYTGDLLPDCSGEWIEADRERLRSRAQQVLSKLAGLLESERAIAPGQPDVVVVSASSGPYSAYIAGRSDGRLYRRHTRERWERVRDGWPEAPSTIAPAALRRRESRRAVGRR